MMKMIQHFLTLWAIFATAQATVYTPSSRFIPPRSIQRTTGNVKTEGLTATLQGPDASVTFDFGRIIAGTPTLAFGNSSCGFLRDCSLGLPSFVCFGFCQGLGIGYTESAQFIKPSSDQTFLPGIQDQTLYLPIPGKAQKYELPAKWGRGGFRYLTLSLNGQTYSDTSVTVSVQHVFYTAEPEAKGDLSPTGSFESSDPLLNDIWAAGIYTTQLCTVGGNTSVSRTDPLGNRFGWAQSAVSPPLTASESFVADGARRDRNAWSGDLQVSTPTVLVGLNRDGALTTVRRTLDILYHVQNDKGYFAYAGAPLVDLMKILPEGLAIYLGITSAYNSDTYHLWTIVAFADYVLASGDVGYASLRWAATVKAMDALKPNVEANGLFRVTRPQDWGRVGLMGLTTSANALYYHTLQRMALVTRVVPGLPEAAALAASWTEAASRAKEATNSLLYVPSVGLFKDNTTEAGSRLYPQDGNVLAVLFGLVDDARAVTVVDALRNRWNAFGAPAPELPGSVSPFITSQEVWAQFVGRQGDAGPGLELIRRQWGYMRRAFSNETLVEGYATDGSLNYGFYGSNSDFISITHGWSTGPTYALTTYVAGIRATRYGVEEGQGDWKFMPAVQNSGLTSARASFTVKGKSYGASWTLRAGVFSATLFVPPGSTGTVCVPTLGKSTLNPLVNAKRPSNVTYRPGYACWSNQVGGTLKITV